ncbi:hypothetical protein A7978_04390 (plasmid) [Borrelia turicatae]|uniref:Lipoprotein n=2 Tax=Borrelia turicatae TaxID=142 RepID=T1ECH8_BORT9|nr:virulence associated lipoprotein [Borrelia turicatae]ADN26437.1 hypothetical protein BTA010 [Borrelia turicatae 91E135]ANF34352.1 hypothetical protein A7978_04390 [Borrelia turicatae]UPA13937.1 hypothetical protein bt91E135_001099 [Borrelia turicatae 91E135]UPA15430.1 hypothetical protein btBTE5EL_001110 [Borrelia turicatae]
MKHKVFIIFILASLVLFIACDNNPNKTDPAKKLTEKETKNTEEDQKQEIVNNIKNLLPMVTQILTTHNDNNWDENAQGYDLTAANQLFAVIQHTPQGQAGGAILYNSNDADSKVARREMYLAFEYNKDYIKAFGTLANKMAATATATPAMKTILEGIVHGMREYADAYYLKAFYMLNNKKDELKNLSLDKLQTLLNKINAIQEAKTNIVNAVNKIKEDYDTDKEVGTATHKLKTTATATEIKDYLESKQGTFVNDITTIKNTTAEILTILI